MLGVKFKIRQGAALLTALVLLIITTVAQADYDLASIPPQLGASVEPNVMILFDNSGSMDNVVWESDFDPTKTYEDWSNGGRLWDKNDANIQLSNIISSGGWWGSSGPCGSGEVEGRFLSQTKCLKLPSPQGNSTRYDGAYLNYLFEKYPDGTNLSTGLIPGETRLTAAQDVVHNLVDANPTLRFGLATFNAPRNRDSGPGGDIRAEVGVPKQDLFAVIDQAAADSNTPLAETYYEITRYFRGLSSFYNGPKRYKSPIQYSCQNNFVLVVTDGYPTYDDKFPSRAAKEPAYNNFNKRLPDWDGKAPRTTQADYNNGNIPPYSDGYNPNGNGSGEGSTLFLDDLALFGREINLLDSQYGIELQDLGKNYEATAHLKTYTIGFAIANQMLEDAAEYGDGQYFTAGNAQELSNALEQAVSSIKDTISSATSTTVTAAQIQDDYKVYQASFDTTNWSGHLKQFELSISETTGEVTDFAWDAAEQLPAPANRNIFTSTATGATTFHWANLDSDQQQALNLDRKGRSDGLGADRVSYLRGTQSQEQKNSGPFRNRTTVLGDIVNSDILLAEKPPKLDLPATQQADYQRWRKQLERPDVIYAGANDGMIHAFKAETGEELFAYVPKAVYGKLSALSAPDYRLHHQFLVDGPMQVHPAYINGRWRSILVAGLGAGGQGLVALDVTDPENFGPDDVLWDYTGDDGLNDYSDYLGYTFARPQIVTVDGDWYVVVGNGYNSAKDQAYLLTFDLATGQAHEPVAASTAKDNGLSGTAIYRVSDVADTVYVYAGDLQGQLTRFKWNGARFVQDAVKYQAKADSTPQPITSQPQIGPNVNRDGVLVYFGTGEFFTKDAKNTQRPQGFYAIADNFSNTQVTQNQLLEQQIQQHNVDDFEFRTVTQNKMTSQYYGWRLALPSDGERQISDAIVRDDRIIFTTAIPSSGVCASGGFSWLMEVSAQSGTGLDSPPFDINDDGVINEDDKIEITGRDGETKKVVASGRRTEVGISSTPSIVESETGQEVKVLTGSSGGIKQILEKEGEKREGRMSWRQIL